MGKAVFSGNSNYTLDVEASLVSQSGLTSRIYWRMSVIKGNTYGNSAWGNTGSTGSVSSSAGKLWSNGNMEYNFQNGQFGGTFKIAEGYLNVQHDSAGNASYYVSGSMNLYGLGSATAGTGTRSLPRIQTATAPPAPKPLGFGTVSMTSIEYRFQSNGNGGSPILEWQALYKDVTANGPQISYKSTGSTDLGGLIPGHTYSFWSRGRNAVGWGPWSAAISSRTQAGARVIVNGQWREAVPFVRVNGAWKYVQPYAKINGIWRKSS